VTVQELPQKLQRMYLTTPNSLFIVP